MENFLTKLFSRRENVRELTPQQTGVPRTTDPNDPSNQPPKSADWSSKVVNPYGKRSLLVPAWYRGVSLIMQTMGQMVTQYQRINKEGGNFVEDRWGYNRQLNWLLQVRPNPLMTASQLQEQIEYRKIYFGNAFVYIERDEFGDPQALWLCTGGGYNPLTDMYTLTYNGTRGPVIRMQTESRNVLHFKNVFLTDDFYMGIPTLDFAYKALQIAGTADEQALQDVAKGGRHKVLLQEASAPNGGGTRGRSNPNELRKTAKRFGEDWAAGDVVILDNVMNPQIVSQTSQQLQLLEQRAFQVSDLARILGVPRIMMMEDAGSSYKMPEHATQEFMLRTIQPRIREWEDELNAKLLVAGDFGSRRIHVCELPLRRLDAKGQAEIDKLHLETGVNTVNELRNQYDLPTVANGDITYVSTNLAELGSEKLSGNVTGGRPATQPVVEPKQTNNDEQAQEGGK
jgi:HK97 family phage portal protein